MSQGCGSEAAQRLNSAVGQTCNVVDTSVCARIDQQWQYRIYCKSLKSSERQVLHRYLERATLTQIQSNTGEYSRTLVSATCQRWVQSDTWTYTQVETVTVWYRQTQVNSALLMSLQPCLDTASNRLTQLNTAQRRWVQSDARNYSRWQSVPTQLNTVIQKWQ